MWDCPACGAMNIAADLTVCPQCGTEREMPKTTADGPSNAGAAEGETGYIPPDEEESQPADSGTPEQEAPEQGAPDSAPPMAETAGAADEVIVGKGTANAGGEAGGP